MSNRHAVMKSLLGAVCVAGVLFTAVPAVAYAGRRTESASCQVTGQSTGFCEGTFLGFQKASDPNAFVQFANNNGQHRQFTAEATPGVTYFCIPSDPGVIALWNQAMAHRGYFKIEWNNGWCTYLWLTNGSEFTAY